jgi:NADPH-dependent ferric siderophore reductase
MRTHDTHRMAGDRPVAPERRLRIAEVRAVEQFTPHMKRITVGSSALQDFAVSRPAQWVKLFVPTPGSEKPSGRAYTIRAFREARAEMDIDFVLHGDGPCASWAEQARIGDVIQIAGPRSGFRLDPEVRHLLIGGDETALPAIGAIVESLPAGLTVDAFIEIPGRADIQTLRSRADVTFTWRSRDGAPAGTGTALQDAMIAANFSDTASGVWVAAEAAAVRAVRRHFQVERGLDRRRITASGYWKHGETDFHDQEGDP